MNEKVKKNLTIVIDRKYSEGRTLAIDLFARLIANSILKSRQQNNDSNYMTEADQSCGECQLHMPR